MENDVGNKLSKAGLENKMIKLSIIIRNCLHFFLVLKVALT